MILVIGQTTKGQQNSFADIIKICKILGSRVIMELIELHYISSSGSGCKKLNSSAKLFFLNGWACFNDTDRSVLFSIYLVFVEFK